MPRFHFNLSDGRRVHDDEGIELANIGAARITAVTYLAETIKDNPDEPWNDGEMTVEVTDHAGLIVCTATLVCHDAPAAPREHKL